MTSLLTRGCQQGGGGRGARLLAVRWGPEPGGGCTGRCCAAPREEAVGVCQRSGSAEVAI